jgi:hypothetical protein
VVEGPGSIPGAIRLSKKQWVWNAVHSAENTAVGVRRDEHAAPFYPEKLALTSRTSGDRSLADSGHRVIIIIIIIIIIIPYPKHPAKT